MSETKTRQSHGLSAAVGSCLAIGSLFVFFIAISLFNPKPIVDEGLHLRVIEQFSRGDRSLPDFLPMLPTYHAVAAAPAMLFGADLLVGRAFNTILGALAILCYAAIVRHQATASLRERLGVGARPSGTGGDAVLHFAFNPILFPFLGLVYTEAASMLCLVGAVYFHVRRRFPASAAAMLAAGLIRQSNLIWVVFLAVWAVVELGQGSSGEVGKGNLHRTSTPFWHLLGRVLARIWSHLAVLALAVSFFVYQGGIAVNAVEANRLRVNIAQFYLFALFAALLFAPVLLERARADWRPVWGWAVRRPPAGAAVFLLIAAAVVVLVAIYRNPHPWNQDLGCLRNWALMGMVGSIPARVLAACCIVGMIPIVVRFTLAQPQRVMLGSAWLFSLLFLLPHSLVEPRYYIVPVLFVNFFTSYTAKQARRMTVWYSLITAVISIAIVFRADRQGGIW